jgi:hypothetical protein
MQNLHKVTETSQFPTFWNEEWLKKAIAELDIRNMSAEQKLAYEMVISANALAVKNEAKKMKELEEKKLHEFVSSLLTKTQHTIEQIADITGTTVDFVKAVNQKIIDENK